MAKYNKHITKKLEQSDIDEWMCDQLNIILNTFMDKPSRFHGRAILLEIMSVMQLANRRKTGDKDDDFRFSDHSRSNYRFNPAEILAEEETVRRFPVQPEQKRIRFPLRNEYTCR